MFSQVLFAILSIQRDQQSNALLILPVLVCSGCFSGIQNFTRILLVAYKHSRPKKLSSLKYKLMFFSLSKSELNLYNERECLYVRVFVMLTQFHLSTTMAILCQLTARHFRALSASKSRPLWIYPIFQAWVLSDPKKRWDNRMLALDSVSTDSAQISMTACYSFGIPLRKCFNWLDTWSYTTHITVPFSHMIHMRC